MQINGGSLSCDYCGLVVSIDFVYYSFDFRLVKVNNWVKNQSNEVIFSVELCEGCMELYRERVKQAYVPPAINRFSCDISGEVISVSSFEYYRCQVSRVEVALSATPYTCETCSKPRDPKAGPCDKCTAETKLLRNAEPKIDDRYLDINLSTATFDKFKKHIEYAKTGVNEWSAHQQ